MNSSLIERQHVENKYLTLFGTLLDEDLEKELTGNFRKTVITLFKDPYEYQAEELKKGCEVIFRRNNFFQLFKNVLHLLKNIKGIGTNENLLIEIICSKDAKEIKQLRKAFKKRINFRVNAMINFH